MAITVVMVSRFEFEQIDLAIASLLANQLVVSDSECTRDQCQSTAVTLPVNLSFSFPSHISRHLIFEVVTVPNGGN